MKVLIVVLTFLICCGFSCTYEDECVSFRLGEETVLRHGVEYCSSDLFMQLSIDDIQDSRCPEGVVCVWQGEVSVKISIETSEVNEIILQSLHHPIDTLDQFAFILVDVVPYPKYKQPVVMSDYRITVKVVSLNE
jgi:hypothetical protein